MCILKNGKAVFQPISNKMDLTKSSASIKVAGETDTDITFMFVSATLSIKIKETKVSLVRLSWDILNMESDLSGSVTFEANEVDKDGKLVGAPIIFQADGGYRLYTTVSFEYYLDLSIKFKILPISAFEIRLDGSYTLAEETIAKGGIPKTPYKDVAASVVTSIYATDGATEYFKDTNNILLESDTGYNSATVAALLDTEEIVDIDNYYVYILSGNTLKRVGRTAGTERTIRNNVDRVIGSDTSYIYYTEKALAGHTAVTNVIKKLYRSNFEKSDSVAGESLILTSLPTDWEAIRMRYDYMHNYYVIYAVHTGGEKAYFVLDNGCLTKNNINNYTYWAREEMGNGAIAYYSQDKNGNINDCIMEYAKAGISHCDYFESLSVSPLGVFMVIKKEGGILPYELVLYTMNDENQMEYKHLGEVNDAKTANRMSYYGEYTYFIDDTGASFVLMRTDGERLVELKSMTYFASAVSGQTVCSEVHDSWLFIYVKTNGKCEVMVVLELATLEEKPYCVDGYIKEANRANLQDVTFTLNESAIILASYINIYSEEEFKKTDTDINSIKSKVDKIKGIIAKKFPSVKDFNIYSKEIMRMFKEASDAYALVAEWDGIIEQNKSITITKELLEDFGYGTYICYIITDKGVVTVNLKIMDSRTPNITDESKSVFYKDKLNFVTKKINIYDKDFSITGYKKGTDYLVYNTKLGEMTLTFTAIKLLQKDYGEEKIILVYGDGDKLEFNITIGSTKSPADKTYSQIFDKSFPTDVVFKFDLYDEKYISSVGGATQYEYTLSDSNEILTFNKTNLMNKENGRYTYKITTAEKEFNVTIDVMGSVLATVGEVTSFDIGREQDLVVDFEKGDADTYIITFANEQLTELIDYIYNKATKKLSIKNSFLQEKVPYGDQTFIITTVYETNATNLATTSLEVEIYDTRTPTLNTDIATYSDTPSGCNYLISANFYNNDITCAYVMIDGKKVDMTVYKSMIGYRGGNVEISGSFIMNNMQEGKNYPMTIGIGKEIFNITFNIHDTRKPYVVNLTNYCINNPSNQYLMLYLYGEELLGISGNGINEDDYTCTEVESSVYLLIVKSDFLDHQPYSLLYGIELVGISTEDGQSGIFSRNIFDIDIPCYIEFHWPKWQWSKHPMQCNDPIFPDIDVNPSVNLLGVDIVQEKVIFDVANPSPIVLDMNYGLWNMFGAACMDGIPLPSIGKDYVFSILNTVTLDKNYLKMLSYGKHIFTVVGILGKLDSVIIEIVDSREPQLEVDISLSYDRYGGIGSVSFKAMLYDSKVSAIEIDNVRYTSGFSTAVATTGLLPFGTISIKEEILKNVMIGTRPIYIYFNDCQVYFNNIFLTITDSGLYYDKTIYIDKNTERTDKFIPWTLYEGNITMESITGAPFTVLACNNSGITFTDYLEADYGSYEYKISLNGHTFKQKIVLHDSRYPTIKITDDYDSAIDAFVFDKGSVEYTLDPFVAASYDMTLSVMLYDASIDGLDVMTAQTIHGADIEYGDYIVEKSLGIYTLSYFFLYGLPMGTYQFYITTTKGKVVFNIDIRDSKQAVLIAEPTYDYQSLLDAQAETKLFDMPVTSVSVLNADLQQKVDISEHVYTEKNVYGNDVLFIEREILEHYCCYSGIYKFYLRTLGREKDLEIPLTVYNGEKKPVTVKFVYVDVRDGLPTVKDLPAAQYLFPGECVQEPETPQANGFEFVGWYTQKRGGEKYDFSKKIVDGQEDFLIFMRWAGEMHTITFVSEGNIIQTMQVAYLSDIPTMPTPTRTGYSFYRWKEIEDSTIRFTTKKMPARDIVLYAEWEKLEYRVVFKTKSGVTLSEQKVYAFEDAVPPSPDDMVLENHTFVGWSASYQNVASDLVLMPVYEVLSYSITYNLNGGINSAYNPSSYTVDDIIVLKNASKDGYQFVSWCEDEDCTKAITSIATGTTGDKVFYAKWQANTYYIVYNKNKPNTNAAVANNIGKTTCLYGDETSITEERYELIGYEFLGWATQANGEIVYNVGDVVCNLTVVNRANINLYACWRAITYTVQIDANLPVTASVLKGNNLQKILAYDEAWSLKNCDLSLEGYKLIGWKLNNVEYSLDEDIKNLTAENLTSITIELIWKAITYKVLFNSNGGNSGEMTDAEVKYDMTLVLSENAFTKNGYSFAGGWATEKQGEIKYTSGSEVINLTAEDGATIVLYAVWTPNIYTIAYELNEGTNDVENISEYTVGNTYVFKTPKKEGYSFEGWYTDSEFKNSIEEITATTYGSLTLYASWIQMEVAMTVILDTTFDYNLFLANMSNFSAALSTYGINPNWSLITYGAEVESTAIEAKDVDFESLQLAFGKAKMNVGTSKTALLEALGFAKTNATIDNHVKQVFVVITTHNYITDNSYGYNTLRDAALDLLQNSISVMTIVDSGLMGRYSEVTDITAGRTVNIGSNFMNNELGNIAYKISAMVRKHNVKLDDDQSLEVLYGSKIVGGEMPEKTGYTFVCYEDSIHVHYLDGTMIAVRAWDKENNGELHSVWIANQYTIRYYNGEEEYKSLQTEYTIEDALDLALPEKTGYTFVGWHEVSDLSDDAFTAMTLGTHGDKVYYAEFVANTYTIHYEANGGSGKMEKMLLVYDDQEIALAQNSFTRVGYTFSNWLYNETEYTDKALVKNLTTLSEEINFVAQWRPLTYEVTLYNGGDMIEQKQVVFDAAMPTTNAPIKDYYKFIGYFDAVNGQGKKYYNGDGTSARVWDEDKDVDLFAYYTPIEYPVTYNLDGGINATSNPASYTVEDDTIVFAFPKKFGYDFEGWYSDVGYQTEITQIDASSHSAITIFAKWQGKESMVVFNMDGGSDGDKYAYVVYGNAMPLITVPQKQGYDFIGYYSGTIGTGRQYYTSEGLSVRNYDEISQITLYAYWKPIEYSITYHLNNGINSDGNSGTYTIETATFDFLAPYRTGYKFLGWFSEEKFETEIKTIEVGSIGDVVLYAKWEAETYTATIKWQNKDSDEQEIAVIYDADLPTVDFQDYYGYTFLGIYDTTTTSGKKYYSDTLEPCGVWDKARNSILEMSRNVQSLIPLNSNIPIFSPVPRARGTGENLFELVLRIFDFSTQATFVIS